MTVWCRLRYMLGVMIALQAGTAHAACHALHPLPDIVKEVGYFATVSDPHVIAASAQRMESLRRSLYKNRLYQMLEPLNLQGELAAIMGFKIKLGVLVQYTQNPGPTSADTFLRTSDFLRSYHAVARLVSTHCKIDVAEVEGLSTLKMGSSAPSGGGFTLSPQAVASTGGLGQIMIVIGLATLAGASLGGIWLGIKQRRRRRRNTRFSCDLDVTITISPNSFTRSVVNISCSGINVKSKTPLPVHAHVGLKFDAFALGADVVWADHAHAGLKFQEPISEAQLQDILQMCRLKDRPAKGSTQTKTAPAEVPHYRFWYRCYAAASARLTRLLQ